MEASPLRVEVEEVRGLVLLLEMRARITLASVLAAASQVIPAAGIDALPADVGLASQKLLIEGCDTGEKSPAAAPPTPPNSRVASLLVTPGVDRASAAKCLGNSTSSQLLTSSLVEMLSSGECPSSSTSARQGASPLPEDSPAPPTSSRGGSGSEATGEPLLQPPSTDMAGQANSGVNALSSGTQIAGSLPFGWLPRKTPPFLASELGRADRPIAENPTSPSWQPGFVIGDMQRDHSTSKAAARFRSSRPVSSAPGSLRGRLPATVVPVGAPLSLVEGVMATQCGDSAQQGLFPQASSLVLGGSGGTSSALHLIVPESPGGKCAVAVARASISPVRVRAMAPPPRVTSAQSVRHIP